MDKLDQIRSRRGLVPHLAHPPTKATTEVLTWSVWPGVSEPPDISEGDAFAVSEALRYLKAKSEAET